MTVPARREAVQLLVARGLSQRRACILLQLPRSTRGYQGRLDGNVELVEQVHALARRYPRYGVSFNQVVTPMSRTLLYSPLRTDMFMSEREDGNACMSPMPE